MKKTFVLFSFVCVIFLNSCGVFLPVTDEVITNSTTWRWFSGEVNVWRNILVEKNAVLVIEPGVTVRFNAGYGIIVRGKLQARGTPGQPVNFAGRDGKKWNGIRFTDSDGKQSGYFEYCNFEGGGIAVDTGYVEVKQSKFSNMNTSAVYSQNLDYTERTDVSNCWFYNCDAGIEAGGNSLISAKYCEFRNCREGVRASSRYSRAEVRCSNFIESVYFNFVNQSLSDQNAGDNYWGGDNTIWIEYRIYDGRDKNVYGRVLYGMIDVLPRTDAGPSW